MVGGFLQCYFITFLSVSAGFSVLAAWTTLFYRKKTWGQLTRNELKVKQGDATVEDRFDVFFRSFVSSVFTWQIHLIALVLAVVYILATRFSS